MSASLEPGLYPFWFWNAGVDEAGIRAQVAEMAAKGIRGFFIHSRQGLKAPYLSRSFFDLVGVAIDAAAEHGMSANLYDEYPYPSGVAGGEVVLGSPEHQATRLDCETRDHDGGPVRIELPRGRILCCRAYPLRRGSVDWAAEIDCLADVGMSLVEDSFVLMGLTAYNRKRYFASRPTPVLDCVLAPGRWRIVTAAQVQVTHHKYWGAFVDALNPQAVRRFIELTHERYWSRFASRFGASIRAAFVDETSPLWSARIPEAFAREYGYDLLPLLPALCCEDHPRHVGVTADFERLRHRLFAAAFDAQLAAWCRDHGIAYAGEKPSYRLSHLGGMDIPGCDLGHTKAGAASKSLEASLRHNARATASAAHLYGRAHALCECYHSLGWGGTLADARLIADELLLMGIDVLVPHAFFYSTHGLRKHDAPPSFFTQMPSWPLFALLSERVGRIAGELAGTWIDAHVLLVDQSPGVPSEKGRAAYEGLMRALMEARVDFLVADTDVLERAVASGGTLSVRDLSVRVIVVPPMRSVEPELEGCLARCEGSGVAVIRMDEEEDWTKAAAAVAARVQPALPLVFEGGEAGGLYAVARTDGSDQVHLLLNTRSEPVRLRVVEAGPLREEPLGPAPALLERHGSGYARELGPFEAVLLTSRGAGAGVEAPPPRTALRLAGAAALHPANPNLLRMGRWSLALGGRGRRAARAEVEATPLANQLAEGRLAFAPAFEQYFGHEPEMRLPPLKLEYRFELDCRYDGRVELVMEPDSLRGDWEASVNGALTLSAADFGPSEAHVDGSLGAEITRALEPGRNRIAVRVTTDRADGGLVSPLYLAGDFAVRFDPLRLEPPAREGTFEDYEANGFPFYAGTMEYELEARLERLPDAPLILLEPVFERPFEEACELSFNGGPWRAAPWSPYRVAMPRDELLEGANRLRVRVHTSLIRSFEGQRFDATMHRYVAVG